MTYHELGEKGVLKEQLVKPFPADTLLSATEKIDGTNVRIIFNDDFTIIGSREEFLCEMRDVVGNPSMGIVQYFKGKYPIQVIDSAWGQLEVTQLNIHILKQTLHLNPVSNPIIVLYGEFYGHKVGAASKNYTKKQQNNFRLFDIVKFNDIEEIDAMMEWESDKISLWREAGGQNFGSREELDSVGLALGFDLTPVLFQINSNALPTDLKSTYEMLSKHKRTTVGIDTEAVAENNLQHIPVVASNNSEGIVIRTPNRSHISKLRFEDYERKPKTYDDVYQ